MILTNPIDNKVSKEQLMDSIKVSSWFYTNTGRYGSPEHDKREDKVEDVFISEDRRSIVVSFVGFDKSEKWTDRVYLLGVNGSEEIFGNIPSKQSLTAFYTLRSVPE